MKEKLESKINDIINYIIQKPLDQITYNEYCILDAKLKTIEYKEIQEHNREDYNMLLGKLFINNSLNPAPIPMNSVSEFRG